MSYKFEEAKDVIIEGLVAKIKNTLPAKQGELCSEFARQFFVTAALEDLQSWDAEDLFGAAVNFWDLFAKRTPAEIKIRIYNPGIEENGWQTTHTVVEVLCQDMPFMVDSISMVIHRMGFSSHLTIHMGGIRLIRDNQHEVSDILSKHGDIAENSLVEAPIFILIDRQTDHHILEDLRKNIEHALVDNAAVTEDWLAMRARVREYVKELEHPPKPLDHAEVEETKAFLTWLEDHHFTFLGMRDYKLVQAEGELILQPEEHTGIGVLRDELNKPSSLKISEMNPEARELTISTRILVVSKTNTLASVHRNAYTDYIGVKRFDELGRVIGERRILGLYTSAAYNTSPRYIPFLRQKVALIMEKSMLNPKSHAGKILNNILETLPRDDLIQASAEQLLEISMGIFYMQERPRIRMFARMDMYRRFISCFVYAPKERVNTELRLGIQEVLRESFNAREITANTNFSESILARVHYTVRINPLDNTDYDFKEIEKKVIAVGRSWNDDLQQFLYETMGEEQGNHLYARYKSAFPAVYQTNFSPKIAVYDIKHIEQLSPDNALGLNFYKPLNELADNFRLKIYQHDVTIPLSDVLPILENLGLRAISERPYMLKFEDNKIAWINEFTIQYTKDRSFQLEEIKELFQNAFTRVWFNDAENDRFNQLVLSAGIDWRQVTILRAYAKYFKQIGVTFSQDYIEKALNQNPHLAKKLVKLFELRFDCQENAHRQRDVDAIKQEIDEDLHDVVNLDEDKIIRLYISVILATVRTNFYQRESVGQLKSYISFKFNSKSIPGLPKPAPMFEIFVYAVHMEGIHLRCEKVARGGLRWSDRREDFRTEVLGLMKAQQVKNAVIVPSGAKGGFVIKRDLGNASREEILHEGIACYKMFIRGLLDITDNYQNASVVRPSQVIAYDENDPYLVVAADKGTATFSDIANEISAEYGFWLGDAFASGGSVGYDHKKMGITAKGAWESVKRHFYANTVDINKADFTVVGVGDMAGDVFGNGMLLSPHIQLVAAFNHMHIFIDPAPSAAISYQERQRLFDLPRSNWSDYDKKLISAGGGVFNRNAKYIVVSSEMKKLFGIKQAQIEPNELIKVILKAKVDLLWSAGIGTFVKASTENHVDVGDRTNDAIRVNAKSLRCKIVGEGGNLGFTQLARIEYANQGGLIYTDFIDNSAGVSCSDKEVNIKILLNSIVNNGDMTTKQRHDLLSEMTDEVAALVLRENFSQTRAISLTTYQAKRHIDLHIRYITELEKAGKLDRKLEFLPDDKVLQEYKLTAKGLSSPIIAVLSCYSKIHLKEAILASDVPEEPYLEDCLVSSFPKPLQEKYRHQMHDHPLKREIIATKISNIIVNEMGFYFVHRMQDETGASVAAIVRAYMTVRSIVDIDAKWSEIEALGTMIDAVVQYELLILYVRLLRRMTRWILRNRRTQVDMQQLVTLYAPGISELKKSMPAIFGEEYASKFVEHEKEYIDMGLPESLAKDLSITRGLYSAIDILDIAHCAKRKIADVARLYFGIGEYLNLGWIRSHIIAHTTGNHWETLSRESLRDDLDWQQRQLTMGILGCAVKKKNVLQCLEDWSQRHGQLIERWQHVLENLRSNASLNYTMFFVAIRELSDLTQSTLQVSESIA